MSANDRKNLEEASALIARVMREHRYSHVEGTGSAVCECGIEAPMTLCEWDIRHHISEQIADALHGGS